MLKYETKNYIFNYNPNSKADEDIEKIAEIQEACFGYICSVLRVKPDFKINYFLCQTPEEVGHIYGDDDPTNGFCSPPDTIYAVYNDQIKCIGFHEDAHLISYVINKPENYAIREGLAMYFDKVWWGISNLAWTSFFIRNGQFISIEKMVNNEVFQKLDCSISYPIIGAFVEWLINSFGIDKYLDIYKHKNPLEFIECTYGVSIASLGDSFFYYVKLINNDEVLEKRMAELVEDNVK